MTSWILVDSPSTTPLSACETFNRLKCLVKSPNGAAEIVPVVRVLSVFTEPQNRRKGYAGLMMRPLSQRIPEITGGKGLSILYSAIGPKFYFENGGWKCYDAHELVLLSENSFEDTKPAKLLNLKQAEEWIHNDVKELVKEFDLKDVDNTTIHMVPQHSQLSVIHSFRSTSTLKHLNTSEPALILPIAGGYMLWSHEYRRSILKILRLREPSSDAALRGLLQEATAEAKRSGLEGVSIWSPTERLERISGIEKKIREYSLPCLLTRSRDENMRWVNIERF